MFNFIAKRTTHRHAGEACWQIVFQHSAGKPSRQVDVPDRVFRLDVCHVARKHRADWINVYYSDVTATPSNCFEMCGERCQLVCLLIPEIARLKSARDKSRIWPTQFGFCSQKNCADAVFVLESTLAAKNWRFIRLALNWAKNFLTRSLHEACFKRLLDLAYHPHLCAMIGSIYSDRQFAVRDSKWSALHKHNFGVCKGCPFPALHPHDGCVHRCKSEPTRPSPQGANADAYVDDTIIVRQRQITKLNPRWKTSRWQAAIII